MVASVDNPIICPFTVVTDSNESAPWTFMGLRDLKSRRPVVTKVETKAMFCMSVIPITDSNGEVHRIGLADYSIAGHEEHIQIERKSVSDLFATMSGRFRRFESEVCRLHQTCDYAAVIVEGSVGEVLRWSGPGRHPKSVIGAVKSWKQRYPGCHWFFCQSRADAEAKCFEVFDRYWKDFESGKLLRQRGGAA